MSKTAQYTQQMPAADRTQPYAMQMAPVLERMVAFLGSRAQNVSLPILADGSGKSPIEFAPKQAHTTFSRREVVEIVREVVGIMSEAPSPTAVRDLVPSYATGPKAALKDMLPLMSESYTPTKGKNEGVALSAPLHCLAAFRRNMGRMAKRNAVLAKVEAGDAYYGEAVPVIKAYLPKKKADQQDFRDHVNKTLNDKNGVARPFPSMKKAQKAVCRAIFGEDWYATDKAKRLAVAAKFVYGQADSVGRTDQHAVNQHTTAVLEGMHHATVKKLARQAGAPASATASKAKAIQWFSDDITRMQGITL